MKASARPTLMGVIGTEILRRDYQVLDGNCTCMTRFAHEQKLECLHALCLRRHAHRVSNPERIRRQLYCRDVVFDCPSELLLIQAYLPAHVLRLPIPDRDDGACLQSAMQCLQNRHPDLGNYGRFSNLRWQGNLYLFLLPADIHTLLIERDSALLAA